MAETDQEKKSQQEEQEKLLPEAEEHEGLEGSGEALNPVIQPMGNEGSPEQPSAQPGQAGQPGQPGPQVSAQQAEEIADELGPDWSSEEVAREDVSNASVSSENGRTGRESSGNIRVGQRSSFRDVQHADGEVVPENELQRASNAMQPVQDTGFQPVTSRRKKPGFFRRLWNRITVLFGRASAVPVAVAASPYLAVDAAVAASKMKKAKRTMQGKKQYELIPGWNGAKYEKKKEESGRDILMDQRRVPTVWSYLTAGKAVDDEGKPLKPEVTVYVDQPKLGSGQSVTMSGMGHTMIGINYSRFSRMTNRFERYAMKYGFYMQGGYNSTSAQNAMGNRNATVPGEMHDDRAHMYTLSRRYPATPAQVNSIVKASETYAEGGYNYFKRNCTTFVKEMVVDVAKLDTGGTIFEQEEVSYNLVYNTLRWGGAAFDPFFQNNLKKDMARYSRQDDLSYQNYGNKRLTREELKRFNESNTLRTLSPETYSPSVTGENMRRITGSKPGVLGSYKFAGDLGSNVKEANMTTRTLNEQIQASVEALASAVQALFPEEQQGEDLPPAVVEKVQEIFILGDNAISDMDTEYEKISKEREKQGLPEIHDVEGVIEADRFRQAHEKISADKQKVSDMYLQFFKGDDRLLKPVTDLLSIYELTLMYLDSCYSKASKQSLTAGDLGNIRQELETGPMKLKADGISTTMSPTHYESYIQIYKTPDKAIAAYAKYQEYKKRNGETPLAEGEEQGRKLSRREKAEYQKLDRLETLAKQFDKAHTYMLERGDYSQQDVDYAFSLGVREKQGLKQNFKINSSFTSGESAAGIYKSLILEKVFGGLKAAWMGGAKSGGLSEEVVSKLINDPSDENVQTHMGSWLDRFLTGRAEQGRDRMKMLVRGLYRSESGHTRETIQEHMLNLLRFNYVSRAFAGEGQSDLENLGCTFMLPALAGVMRNEGSGFVKLLRAISDEVISEAGSAEQQVMENVQSSSMGRSA